MTTHTSICTPGRSVTFPQWQGERHYMLPFTKKTGLAKAVARFTTTVEQMMSDINSDQECYLMIDESEVAPGTTHRRSGLHVDGYWHPAIQCHGGSPGRHGGSPGWPQPPKHAPVPSHRPCPPKHGASGVRNETLLLASSHSACRAFTGRYERDFTKQWNGGDCSDLDTQHLQEMQLASNLVYALDVMSLHESLPVQQHVKRTLVRINVPT